MEDLLYFSLNLFCVIILGTIFSKLYKSVDKRLGQVMLMWFIIASIILCASDIIWGLVNFSNSWQSIPYLAYIVNSVYHIFTGVVCYLWFLFSESEQKSMIVRSRIGLVLSMLPLIVLVGLVVCSFDYNLVFYIDNSGEYHRGRFYVMLIFICYAYIMFTSVKVFFKSLSAKHSAEKQKYRTLARFCVAPACAGVLQVMFVGSPLLSTGLAFAALQVYMNSMEQLISVDPMTQLNNRRQLETHLDNRLKQKSDKKDLYVFIMDLDYFKKINDTFGHDVGDDAIITAADAIRNVASVYNFFASRYGGDEFVVVADVDKDFLPENFVNELNDELQRLTTVLNKDYNLHFSIGYAKYDESLKTSTDILKKADEGLYKIKKSRTHLVDILQ